MMTKNTDKKTQTHEQDKRWSQKEKITKNRHIKRLTKIEIQWPNMPTNTKNYQTEMQNKENDKNLKIYK